MLPIHKSKIWFVALFLMFAGLSSLGCDLATPTKTTPQMQIVGWGQNNILSKWIEVRPPQSFLVVKVRLPFDLVGNTQPDGSFLGHISSRDFTLVRTQSALGVRDFQPAGAKTGSEGYLEGDIQQNLNFPQERKPEFIEWIVFFPLTTADASLPSYALRFRDQPLVRLTPTKREEVESLTDPQVVWPATGKP